MKKFVADNRWVATGECLHPGLIILFHDNKPTLVLDVKKNRTRGLLDVTCLRWDGKVTVDLFSEKGTVWALNMA